MVKVIEGGDDGMLHIYAHLDIYSAGRAFIIGV